MPATPTPNASPRARPATGEPTPPTIPFHVVGHRLGSGADADVWEAQHQVIDQAVAVKVLRSPNDLDRSQRFLNEARLSRTLRHRNLVAVHDVGITDEGNPYFSMQRFESSLDKRPPKLNATTLSSLILDIGSSLDYLHTNAVIHRDVKPANVLWTYDSGSLQFSLGDLGLAINDTRLAPGTAPFTAPELLTPGGQATNLSDLFSFAQLIGLTARSAQIHESALLEISHALAPCLRVNPQDRRTSVAALVLELLQVLREFR